jgi:hypothetical protein
VRASVHPLEHYAHTCVVHTKDTAVHTCARRAELHSYRPHICVRTHARTLANARSNATNAIWPFLHAAHSAGTHGISMRLHSNRLLSRMVPSCRIHNVQCAHSTLLQSRIWTRTLNDSTVLAPCVNGLNVRSARGHTQGSTTCARMYVTYMKSTKARTCALLACGTRAS